MERAARHHEPLPRIEAPRSAKHSKALPHRRRASQQYGTRRVSISQRAPDDSNMFEHCAKQTRAKKRFRSDSQLLPSCPRHRHGEDLSNWEVRRETTHPQAMQPPPRTRTSTTRDIRRKASTRIEPTRQESATVLDTRREDRRAGQRNAQQCEQQCEPWHKRGCSSSAGSEYGGRRRRARTDSKSNGGERAPARSTAAWNPIMDLP